MDETALYLKQNLVKETFKTIGVVQLLKIKDRFRSRIILKGRNLDEMRAAVNELFERDGYEKFKNVRIDVNPMTLD